MSPVFVWTDNTWINSYESLLMACLKYLPIRYFKDADCAMSCLYLKSSKY